MYKLFLCMRYLRSRIIAWFAVGAIAVCVWMLISVNSIMNGFSDKIEQAAKGLFGDIVVQSDGSIYGVGHYDKLIGQIMTVEGVEAASPFILTDGYINVSGNEKFVRVAGIPLPERKEVSDFEQGLFVQKNPSDPSWDPSVAQMIEAIEKNSLLAQSEIKIVESDGRDAKWIRKLNNALADHQEATAVLHGLGPYQVKMRKLYAELQAELAKSSGEPTEKTDALEEEISELIEKTHGRLWKPDQRVIMGQGIYFASFRTPTGAVIRRIAIPGRMAKLYVRPLDEFGSDSIEWSFSQMTIVDHCYTGVYNIDDSFIYIPFKKLQEMTKLQADADYDIPARCTQIHVKIAPELTDPEQLVDISNKIQAICDDFLIQNPNAVKFGSSLEARTYRQLQAQLIDSIASQRTLAVTIFGIMSIVSVFLIFVIFYMIVLQKTRDIGILKSIGGSGVGIAGIFLGYGAIVGLVGSGFGIIGGYLFVDNVNAINNWIGQVFGIQFWSMETFMFADIPNQVDWYATAFIVIGAISAGLIGALIPAIIAATRQPIKALRYE